MMTTSNSSFSICPICLKPSKLEGHHITPINYGGPLDGPLLNICSIDHAYLHEESEHASSGKGRKYLFKDDEFMRAVPYIRAIVIAKLKILESGNVRIQRMVLNKMDSKLKIALRKMKMDDGVRGSLDDYIVLLLRRMAKNRGII